MSASVKDSIMLRTLALNSVLFAVTPIVFAQSPQVLFAQPLQEPAAPIQIAAVESSSLTEGDLPDAPGMSFPVSVNDGLTIEDPIVSKPNTGVAPKYALIILPGQTTVPLSAGDKTVYGLHDAFNVFAVVGFTASAGFSQLINSSPHYGGTTWEAFGKREGASAVRNTVQTLTTDALFSPIFHDDPRYYALGYGHKFFSRAFYAATRVVITRSDGGHARPNIPLWLGYGAAAGLNNAYYPDADTGAKKTFESYGSSLAGAVVSFEADEFLDDAIRILHGGRR